MYKYILETAGSIDWMALFALVTFVSIFSIGVLLAFKKDKTELDRMANLPLSNEETNH